MCFISVQILAVKNKNSTKQLQFLSGEVNFTIKNLSDKNSMYYNRSAGWEHGREKQLIEIKKAESVLYTASNVKTSHII